MLCAACSDSSAPDEFTATPSVATYVTADPADAQTVVAETTQSFTLSTSQNIIVSTEVGGTCPEGSWDESVYTTGAITEDCTVSFSLIDYPNLCVTNSDAPSLAVYDKTAEGNTAPLDTIFGDDTTFVNLSALVYDRVNDEFFIPDYMANRLLRFAGDTFGNVAPLSSLDLATEHPNMVALERFCFKSKQGG